MPRLGPRSPAVLALAALLGSAGVERAGAQVLTHVGATGVDQLSQTVELADPWGDRRSDAFFSADARDVLVRLDSNGLGRRSTTVHLMLFGPWGAYQYRIVERGDEATDFGRRGTRTRWFPADVDADGENEIVLIERELETKQQLDERGRVVGGERFEAWTIRFRYLDREDGLLVEHDLEPDPDGAGFEVLTSMQHPGPVRAAIDQAVGDRHFLANEYEKARYRYLLVHEWAERALAGTGTRRETTDTIPQANPDHPLTAWVASTLRLEALPPAFRRR